MRREFSWLVPSPSGGSSQLSLVIAEIGFMILHPKLGSMILHPKLGSKWEEREMWKLLTPVLTIAALCSPVAAQTPVPQHGLKSGYIAWTYTGEVLPGQMDNFKQVVSKVIAAVAQEPGTLMLSLIHI